MKVLPLSFIWCMSFTTMAITWQGFGLVFWLSLLAFVSVNCYIGNKKNKERLERELDELFGE